LLFVFAEVGATSTASGRLEVNLFLSEKRGGGVKLHRYIFLRGASERKLGNKPLTKQKGARKIKGEGLGTQPQKKQHHAHIWLVQKSPQSSWAIPILRKDKLAVLCAKAA
jgi:hypothetical protein